MISFGEWAKENSVPRTRQSLTKVDWHWELLRRGIVCKVGDQASKVVDILWDLTQVDRGRP